MKKLKHPREQMHSFEKKHLKHRMQKDKVCSLEITAGARTIKELDKKFQHLLLEDKYQEAAKLYQNSSTPLTLSQSCAGLVLLHFNKYAANLSHHAYTYDGYDWEAESHLAAWLVERPDFQYKSIKSGEYMIYGHMHQAFDHPAFNHQRVQEAIIQKHPLTSPIYDCIFKSGASLKFFKGLAWHFLENGTTQEQDRIIKLLEQYTERTKGTIAASSDDDLSDKKELVKEAAAWLQACQLKQKLPYNLKPKAKKAVL